jgi:hypothetical protein
MNPAEAVLDIIARIVAQCEEAVPESKKTLDYLLSDYANYLHWRVGETSYDPRIDQEGKVEMPMQVVGRLYAGKLAKGYKGSDGKPEKVLRRVLPIAIAFFYSNLRLTSTAFPKPPVGYSIVTGMTLTGPDKHLDDTNEDGNALYAQFTWTIPLRLPREVIS